MPDQTGWEVCVLVFWCKQATMLRIEWSKMLDQNGLVTDEVT